MKERFFFLMLAGILGVASIFMSGPAGMGALVLGLFSFLVYGVFFWLDLEIGKAEKKGVKK